MVGVACPVTRAVATVVVVVCFLLFLARFLSPLSAGDAASGGFQANHIPQEGSLYVVHVTNDDVKIRWLRVVLFIEESRLTGNSLYSQ